VATIYDLSQPIAPEMSFYPGDPEPRIDHLQDESPWRVCYLHLSTHAGTHVDAPSHYSRGDTITQVPLERWIGRGVVIDVTGKGPDDLIGLDDLGDAEERLRDGLWAVFRTGWSRHWGASAYLEHPSLAPDLARSLAAWRVPLIAVDALNPDSTQRGGAIVHDILLSANVLIAENLAGLDQLGAGRVYSFAMLPLKLEGLDGSPVRAIAWEGELP
jgi:kynurenine formamidase